jgi:hypothetical protein
MAVAIKNDENIEPIHFLLTFSSLTNNTLKPASIQAIYATS